MSHDALGDRIKSQYEDRTRVLLPRRTYTVIRLDGKAFHTLTRGFDRPFDNDLSAIMDQTTIELCEQIQGVKFGYTQSDEISLLLTDFETDNTCAWFDGNVQKMASVSASIATAAFNRTFGERADTVSYSSITDKFYSPRDNSFKTAHFDSRVFTIPDPVEVENYFIWRQNDASRNSIQMAARAVYSHNELNNKGISELHDLLHAKDINWNNYTTGEKRGRAILKQSYQVPAHTVNGTTSNSELVTRTRWVALTGKDDEGIPIFTQDRSFLRKVIPVMPHFEEKNK